MEWTFSCNNYSFGFEILSPDTTFFCNVPNLVHIYNLKKQIFTTFVSFWTHEKTADKQGTNNWHKHHWLTLWHTDWLTPSLTHWLTHCTDSLTDWLIHWLSDWLTFWLTYWLIPSLPPSLPPSLLTHSLLHHSNKHTNTSLLWLIPITHTLTHSLNNSLTNWLTYSLTQSLTHPLTCSRIYPVDRFHIFMDYFRLSILCSNVTWSPCFPWPFWVQVIRKTVFHWLIFSSKGEGNTCLLGRLLWLKMTGNNNFSYSIIEWRWIIGKTVLPLAYLF